MSAPSRDELRTARRLSAALLAVSDQLTVPEVLQTIVDTARELAGAEYAALGVPDDNGSFAQFLVAGISPSLQAAIGPLPRQHGFLALMLRDPEPQRVDDIRADPRFGWWPAAHPVMKAFLGMPIVGNGEILGALFLGNKEGGFTASDEELVGVLAAHAAIALTHARLYDRNRELTIAEERARIAHDLHDAVAQRLFGLRLTVQAADLLLDRDVAAARERLAEVSTLAREAAEELHAAVLELRPADLASEGLAGVLRKQVQILDRAYGVRVCFESDDPALPPSQQMVVLRVAQEALHNAIRHAGAATVRVTLSSAGSSRSSAGPFLSSAGPSRSSAGPSRSSASPSLSSAGPSLSSAGPSRSSASPPLSSADPSLSSAGSSGASTSPAAQSGAALEVADDGAGFDVHAAMRAGLGLRSMRERACSVRGSLDIRSTPGAGTVVRLEVPGG